MKNRTIRSWIWADRRFHRLSDGARVLYMALLAYADDFGLLEDDETTIAISCRPARGVETVAAELQELVAAGLVIRTGGFCALAGFLLDQRPTRRFPVHFATLDLMPETLRNAVAAPIAQPARDAAGPAGWPRDDAATPRPAAVVEIRQQPVAAPQHQGQEGATSRPAQRPPIVSASQPADGAQADEDAWVVRIESFLDSGRWLTGIYGPSPSSPACRAPYQAIQRALARRKLPSDHFQNVG